MKKILSVSMSIMLVLSSVSFISCGNKVETVTVYGDFYDINEAYVQNHITHDELKYIEKNINDDVFTPIDNERKEKIIHDYKQTHLPASDEIEVMEYGTYNGSTVVRIIDRYYDIDSMQDTFLNYYIHDYDCYGDYVPIIQLSSYFYKLRVWKECEAPKEIEKPETPYGAFYSVEKAIEHGFLSGYKPSSPLDMEELPGGQTTQDKILHDFRLLDMRKYDWQGFTYYGEFSGSLVVKVIDGHYYDAFDQTLPVIYVWRPLDI